MRQWTRRKYLSSRSLRFYAGKELWEVRHGFPLRPLTLFHPLHTLGRKRNFYARSSWKLYLKKKKINISKREKLQIYNPPLCKIRNKTKASPLRVQFKSATHRIRKSFYFLHENQQQSSPRQEYGLERTGTQHLWHGLWDSRDGSQALLIVKILRTSTKGRQNKRKGVW